LALVSATVTVMDSAKATATEMAKAMVSASELV
jgi:hypothetical protein